MAQLNLSDISVLIVDDSEHSRALLTMLMRREGVKNVHHAMDGEAAVEKFKELRPALVFLDNMLPKLSGMEALKKIRSFDPTAKVIMISAISTPAVVQEAKEAGASYYLIKPYSPDKVVEVVRRMLDAEGTAK
ncbi:MAG: response regulator [Bacteroidota bacterium]|nr:response regulator [Bacteroidota bacterium]